MIARLEKARILLIPSAPVRRKDWLLLHEPILRWSTAHPVLVKLHTTKSRRSLAQDLRT